MAQDAAVTASRRVAKTSCCFRGMSCSAWECCRNVAVVSKQQLQHLVALQERLLASKQQLQRPGALPEGYRGQEAPSRSIAGACGSRGGKVSSRGK